MPIGKRETLDELWGEGVGFPENREELFTPYLSCSPGSR